MKQTTSTEGTGNIDTSNPDDKTTPSTLSEQAVVDYLRLDPDFFTRHTQLLSELNLPHSTGRTVSLIEHQVSILRERNVESRRKLNQLVSTAQLNDAIFSKTRALTLALLDANSLHGINELLATHILVDFEADFVCCHIVGDGTSLDHVQQHRSALPLVDKVNTVAGTQCMTVRSEEMSAFFPFANLEGFTDDAGSVVLVPFLHHQANLEEPTGLLCIGARNTAKFTPDMDTLFVDYICAVLEKVIARLL